MREKITREGIAALHAVSSPRQWRIVQLWLINFTRAEMSKQLGVSPSTIRNQIARLRGKKLPLLAREIIRAL